ncbi:MAG: 50S ribosomal protein L4 [Parcubacteria group bacterium]
METKLYNQEGKEVGLVDLPDEIFAVPANDVLMHQVVVSQASNQRSPIAHTKGRAEQHGGGRKPWRQKGTGRARHSSIRSPLWKGGAVTFGPTKDRNFTKKITKSMRRKALLIALSSKVADSQYIVVDQIRFENAKTKEMLGALERMAVNFKDYKDKDTVLVVTPKKNRSVETASNNVKRINTLPANSLNAREILSKKFLILTKDSIGIIERTFKV